MADWKSGEMSYAKAVPGTIAFYVFTCRCCGASFRSRDGELSREEPILCNVCVDTLNAEAARRRAVAFIEEHGWPLGSK